MDPEPARLFFLEPQQTFHRRYEALRACVLEGRSVEETAERFGYRAAALRSMVCRFRAACRDGQPPPFFAPTPEDVRPDADAARNATARSRPRPPTGAN